MNMFFYQKKQKAYSSGFIKTTKSHMGFFMSEVEEIDIFDWITLINCIFKEIGDLLTNDE